MSGITKEYILQHLERDDRPICITEQMASAMFYYSAPRATMEEVLLQSMITGQLDAGKAEHSLFPGRNQTYELATAWAKDNGLHVIRDTSMRYYFSKFTIFNFVP